MRRDFVKKSKLDGDEGGTITGNKGCLNFCQNLATHRSRIFWPDGASMAAG